ncbi:dihydrodipicolinate synthase family protein [Phyllobacterium salinisoli]|uniref:Dihydrodipicolinate synthase family protein n=1 Tax=Phyllobacterium salinisoli TaxID=1899321 RepID=A0A368K664_9HYPH|nr:dihydrodipicolinate synthase family protein [Phyllobacterium salinisoli]RCS24849.1 dihydrodipicolinate synthase family protein [Phyllobacterium salinisoli]
MTTLERFGLSVALATPFNRDGSIDLVRLGDHAAVCLEGGCDSITVFGTTGEGASIGADERGQMLDHISRTAIKPGQIVTCIAATSIEDAARQCREALDFGCKALLLPPPFYFKGVSDDGVFGWYAGLLERIGPDVRDAILYNIPSVTSVTVSQDVLTRLRAAFGGVITGIKDSGGNWKYTEGLLEAHSDIAILVGDERHLAAAVQRGGQGAISGIANLFPAEMRGLAIDGQDDARIRALVELVLRYPVVPAIKVLMAHMSGHAGWTSVRAPLVDANDAADTLISSFQAIMAQNAA